MDEARRDGIVMRVVATGQNVLLNDSSQSPFYRPIPNWDAKSEMCVALRDGEQIIGVINVESQRKNAFSQNDFIVLESTSRNTVKCYVQRRAVPEIAGNSRSIAGGARGAARARGGTTDGRKSVGSGGQAGSGR